MTNHITLLIVHSLLRDHDLRVADDYAEGSFREFYDGKIGPHLAHGTSLLRPRDWHAASTISRVRPAWVVGCPLDRSGSWCTWPFASCS